MKHATIGRDRSAGPAEHCDEIAWTPDGFRVGFVINGYQLRIFDARTRRSARRRST